MARFRVAFEGMWQGDFDTLAEAEEWAQEVSSTGRMTWVVRRRFLIPDKLVTAFPKERRDEAERQWKWAVDFTGAGGG